MKKVVLYWEVIDSYFILDENKTVWKYRAKVLGGWIVKQESMYGKERSEKFIEDPEHRWKIK